MEKVVVTDLDVSWNNLVWLLFKLWWAWIVAGVAVCTAFALVGGVCWVILDLIRRMAA